MSAGKPGFGGLTRSGVIGNLTNAAGLLSGNAKAQLIAESGGMPIVFYINPKSVKITKTNQVEGKHGVLVGGFQDAIKATGNVKMVLGDAHITGAGVTQAAADQLIKWATPVETAAPIRTLGGGILGKAGAAAAGLTGAKAAVANSLRLFGGGSTPTTAITKVGDDGKPTDSKYYMLPKLLFSWGLHGPRGSNKPVTLEQVTVDYLRFDPLGLPVWAKFSLTLVEVYEDKPPQNPTSGGVPGRAQHTVTHGENIVQVANRAYDSPHAWRVVAESNGLDDPLRVKPGRTLSLPPAHAAETAR